MNVRSHRMIATIMRGMIGLAAFSFVVNLLLLVQPLYLLQIYDRVLTSGSFDTLLFISLIAGAALILLGLLDAIRAVIASRIAARLEIEAGGSAFTAAMEGPRASLGDIQPLLDLTAVKNFIGGRTIFVWLDLPFSPLFILILYVIHPHLFWMTLIGAAVLIILALLNERATATVGGRSNESLMSANLVAQSLVRNAETLSAMGMVNNAVAVWGHNAARSMTALDRMNLRNAVFSGLSRILRLGLQLAILGYGGYLVLAGEMTAGMIFASSLISGRALQPIDQVIVSWRNFTDTQRAWRRLKYNLDSGAKDRLFTQMPKPNGHLTLENVVVFPPGKKGADPLLKRLSFHVSAGECLVIIGPSGAGKSTLMRTIVGAIQRQSGAVSVDGSDIVNWNPEQLGRHLGYLAQDVDLLPGTVAQNISRFDPEPRDEDIVAAAQKAHVHELVQRLPEGYDTKLGPGGFQLSGGQRQRVGLARAFYGAPRLIVLDEPNANLDAEGEQALQKALATIKADGVTVLIVTQRNSIIDHADKVLILREGSIGDFGSRQDVLARLVERAQPARLSPVTGNAQVIRHANITDSSSAGPIRGQGHPVPARFSTVMTASPRRSEET